MKITYNDPQSKKVVAELTIKDVELIQEAVVKLKKDYLKTDATYQSCKNILLVLAYALKGKPLYEKFGQKHQSKKDTPCPYCKSWVRGKTSLTPHILTVHSDIKKQEKL